MNKHSILLLTRILLIFFFVTSCQPEKDKKELPIVSSSPKYKKSQLQMSNVVLEQTLKIIPEMEKAILT